MSGHQRPHSVKVCYVVIVDWCPNQKTVPALNCFINIMSTHLTAFCRIQILLYAELRLCFLVFTLVESLRRTATSVCILAGGLAAAVIAMVVRNAVRRGCGTTVQP